MEGQPELEPGNVVFVDFTERRRHVDRRNSTQAALEALSYEQLLEMKQELDRHYEATVAEALEASEAIAVVGRFLAQKAPDGDLGA